MRDARRGHSDALLQIDQCFDCRGRERTLESAEMFEVSFQGLPHAPPQRVEHDAAAERAPAGLVADDEAIARERDHRLVQHELHQRALLRCDFARRLEHDRAADSLGGADEQPHAVVVLQRALGGRPNLQPRLFGYGAPRLRDNEQQRGAR